MSENVAESLEVRLARLDAIVTELEREGLELDEALSLFEEGIAHLRSAEQVIRAAELRIERLLENSAGEPVVAPMELPPNP
jgi:exodeoxyribonuclease VII small subunit